MSTIPQTNNKTIAKNTFFLYVRMLLSILVSLYTTRVVLQTLGVDDYGIYGIVGGIVSMFSFLNASMSGATSRFITFALGKNDEKDVEDTFATALLIHIGISFVILLLAETVGIYFLEYKLVIPEARMEAARFVYQFSVLAMIVQVTQVPYNASIIAYEKMDIYAYVELLNVFLKLGIVYLVLVGNLDKLILYAVLYFLVNLLIAAIYRLYCIKKFNSCRFRLIYRKEKLYPMLSFSGWDLYGNMSYSVNHQGINMLINMFFGVAYNAASSFATSIRGVIETLSSNVIQAFRPQIVKNYAIHNIERMETLMCNSLKFSLLLMMLFSVPVICETQELLLLWLGTVPDCTDIFCQLLLIACIFNLINKIILIGIHATGHIKRISLITGTIYLLELPVIYVLFRWFKASPSFAYFATIITMSIVVSVNAYILKKQIPSINPSHYLRGIVSGVTISIVAIVPILPFIIWMEDGVGRLIVLSVIYGVSLLLAIYFFGIDRGMRIMVNIFIREKMSHLSLR
jgi:O-antigen/teichoic acid export membrane protein